MLTQSLFVEPSNNKKMSKEEITQIANLVTDNTLFCTKEVLTSDEAANIWEYQKAIFINSR